MFTVLVTHTSQFYLLGFYRDYYEVHCFCFTGHAHGVTCVVLMWLQYICLDNLGMCKMVCVHNLKLELNNLPTAKR